MVREMRRKRSRVQKRQEDCSGNVMEKRREIGERSEEKGYQSGGKTKEQVIGPTMKNMEQRTGKEEKGDMRRERKREQREEFKGGEEKREENGKGIKRKQQVLTEISLPPCPTAFQFQRNTQRSTLTIKSLTYQLRLLINSYNLYYPVILVCVSHKVWYLLLVRSSQFASYQSA